MDEESIKRINELADYLSSDYELYRELLAYSKKNSDDYLPFYNMVMDNGILSHLDAYEFDIIFGDCDDSEINEALEIMREKINQGMETCNTEELDFGLTTDDFAGTFLEMPDAPGQVDQAMMAEKEWKEGLAVKNSDRIRRATYYFIEHENVYNAFSILLDDPEGESVYGIYDKIYNHPFEYDVNEDEFEDIIGNCNNDETMAALSEAYTYNKAKAGEDFMYGAVSAGVSLDLPRDEFEGELEASIKEYPMTTKEALPNPIAKTPADPFIHKLKEKYGKGRRR